MTSKDRAVLYIARVLGSGEGERNAEAFKLAAAIREIFGLEGDDLLEVISIWNNKNDPPLDQNELATVVKNAERYAQAPAGSGYKPMQTSFPLTDTGNAERFAFQHREKLHYCVESGKWYYWDGMRWNGQIGEERVLQLAVQTVRSIAKEACDVESKYDRDKTLSWSMSSEGAHRINAMITLAKKLPPLVCHASDFDREDFLLSCLNGTVDLRTGLLKDNKPENMITKLAPVKYDTEAQSEVWAKFLIETTQGDFDLIEFLQRAVGYSLCGSTAEEKLFFVYGPGASGKSTFLESIKATLGDYAQTADFESFIQHGQVGGARNDIARLAGTRFVVSIEVDEGRELAEGLIKMITGGDTVSARFLYKESFEFVPRCKLWLAANHAPKVSDRDDAIWRRILRVPFAHTVPVEKRDPTIKAVLRDTQVSGPTILNWAVNGCLWWQSNGLIVPEIITQSTNAYRDSQDPLKDFFETECQFSPEIFTPVLALRQRYDGWAKDNGIRYSLGPRQFNERLQDKGCSQRTKELPNVLGIQRAARCWVGVGLKGGHV